MVEFCFHRDKAVAAMAYVLDSLGEVDKVKLMKLIYLADREHLLRHDRTITGGRLVAMDHGPLPSECLSVINGDLGEDVYSVFHVVDYTVSLREEASYDAEVLTETDKKVLDEVIREYGHAGTWELRDRTHRLPEYTAFYQAGTSTTIPVESLLCLAERGKQDNRGRITVSAEMAAAMCSPFTTDDSDL